MEKLIFLFFVCLTTFPLSHSVDRSNFKTCQQSSFCRRNRALKSGDQIYSVFPNTVEFKDGSITADLFSTKDNDSLSLIIDILQKETIRIRVRETSPIRERYEVDESLDGKPVNSKYVKTHSDDSGFKVKSGQNTLQVTYNPLQLDFFDHEGVLLVTANSKGLMNFERSRSKPEETAEDEIPEPQEGDEEKSEEEKEQDEINRKARADQKKANQGQDGDWEESFKEHKDSKPYGPTSIGMDVSFIGFEHVYGIPEHADSLSLKATDAGEPYRLFNLDVFEYELDNPMALYGSIPFMWAHSERSTVGMFWNNAAETWIDVKSSKTMLSSIISYFQSDSVPEMATHWFSESGIIDLFIMLGPRPHDVSNQYATLTGTTTLPPRFGISYQQCRWNYDDEEDVAKVDAGFDEHDIPYDVIWLDIEHTDDKKYMTWHGQKFPNPTEMIEKVASKGRKMVTIIDPHIKRASGYHIHDEASSKGLYVKNKDGGDYEGWCWPGSSSWIDFVNPDARNWWASKMQLDQYVGSTLNLMTWNDMNEPSVFNGPEVTMHKDAVHAGKWEHRDVHNVYGMFQHMSTFQGHLERSNHQLRPFVLSRAFFAGTQRYGAIWTGDNAAQWSHLKASIPMLLSINVAGLPFCGADVGGFFGNPDSELLVRWYQAGSFTPFFRGHAHLDTKRREPWLFGATNTALIRAAIRRRYALLPLWYTLMHETSVTGATVMRPMWVEFPTDKHTFTMDDQYMIGNKLLVKPVTESGIKDVLVYLPGPKTIWYDFDTFQAHTGGQSVHVDTPMTKVPLFQRGGTIIPMRNRVRRCSSLMNEDPYSLVIALDDNGEAKGELYTDDGHTNDYKEGKYLLSKFEFTNNRLIKTDEHASFETKAWFERIVFIGMVPQPHRVTLMENDAMKDLEFRFDNSRHILVVKKPVMNAIGPFNLIIS